jgi:hypothetical protein
MCTKSSQQSPSRERFQTTDFRDHVDRVQNQYSEMRKLRENLPENEIVLWMDFAEKACSP